MAKYQRGKWGNFQVLLLAEHKQAILQWARASGLPKAAFLRAALLRGAFSLAQEMGLNPALPPAPALNKAPHNDSVSSGACRSEARTARPSLDFCTHSCPGA